MNNDPFQAKSEADSVYSLHSLYNTSHYNMNLDITRSCCGFQIFTSWDFTKDSHSTSHIKHSPFQGRIQEFCKEGSYV